MAGCGAMPHKSLELRNPMLCHPVFGSSPTHTQVSLAGGALRTQRNTKPKTSPDTTEVVDLRFLDGSIGEREMFLFVSYAA